MNDDVQSIRNEIKFLQFKLTELNNRLDKLEGIQHVNTNQFDDAVVKQPVNIERHNVNYNAANQIKKSKVSKDIGKYIIGILASVLVLVALGMFISLIWETIPNIVKWAGILCISIAIACLGIRNITKESNKIFWYSLTSCGMSAIFITIVSGNLVWKLYGNNLTILLILLWTVSNIWMWLKTNNIVFYIIECIGSIVAIVLIQNTFGDKIGIQEQIAYALVTVTYLVISNILRFKVKDTKTEKIIKYTNMGFIVYLALMSENLSDKYGYYGYAQNESVIVLGILTLICIITLLYIFSLDIVSKSTASKIVRFIGIAIIQYSMCYEIHDIIKLCNIKADTDLVTVVVSLIVMLVYILTSNDRLDRLTNSTLIASICISVIADLTVDDPAIMLCVMALVTSIAYERFFKNNTNIYIISRIVLLASFTAYIGIYLSESDNKTLFIIDLILLNTLCIYNYLVRANRKDRYSSISQMIYIIIPMILYLKLVDVFDTEPVIGFVVFVTLWVLHRAFVVNRREAEGIDQLAEITIYNIVVIASHLVCYVCAAFENEAINNVLYVYCLLIMSTYAIYNIVRNRFRRPRIITIISAILCNINIFAAIEILEFSNANLLISITGIIVAIGFVTLGFTKYNKDLRLCGLIMLIVYVLKVAMVDVSKISNSGANIAMILAAGIMCFILSYVYNKLEKKYGAEEHSKTGVISNINEQYTSNEFEDFD